MRVTSTDIDTTALMRTIAGRLRSRGLQHEFPNAGDGEVPAASGSAEPEARVDPLRFSLEALEAHADSARPLPLETHRAGLAGAAVVAGKRLFRRLAQPLVAESLGRQRLFNDRTLDAYAHLAAELERLRSEVAGLRTELARRDRTGARGRKGS